MRTKKRTLNLAVMKLNWNKLRREYEVMKERDPLLTGESDNVIIRAL